MKKLDVPFNITILNLTPDKLRSIKAVTSLDLFDQTRTSFHDEGLYSVPIFGKVGDPMRMLRFSYIDIKIPILHPIVWRAINKLKSFYIEIMEGKAYATWDQATGSFVPASSTEGETGYHFFIKRFNDLKFEENKSITRLENIRLIQKYKDIALTSKIVVMPAGMREVEFEGERVTEDEINEFYRSLLSMSNTIHESAVKTAPELLNRQRMLLQRSFNELYDYILRMLEGKKKFILGKWASRQIFNSTRNVITAMPEMASTLGDEHAPDINVTQVGLYQLIKAVGPVGKYMLRTGFLSQVFQGPTAPVKLVNKKTMQTEVLNLNAKYYDQYMTDEGLDKVLNLFSEDSMRHKPLEIEGRYLGLIYKGPDGTFRLMHGVDELPGKFNPEHVHPMTFCELLYCSVYKEIEKYPAFVTRYPITGIGSIYPSKPRLVPTVETEVRSELGQDWLPQGPEATAKAFPVMGSAFINAFSPNSFHLAKLGADFDGDTSSFTCVYTDESLKEIDEYFNSKRAYIGTKGQFINSIAVDLVDLVFHNMTRFQPKGE